MKFGPTTVRVKLLKKVLKLFGEPVEVIGTKDEPLLVRRNGVNILIAPTESDDPVTQTTEFISGSNP